MKETESLDTAIDQVERLYASITGHAAPDVGDKPYSVIPPERMPEEHVQEQVERLIQTLSRFPSTPATEPEWKPAMTLWEGRDEYCIDFDLPGVERESARVTVSQGVLELTGSRPVPSTDGDASLTLRYAERPFGKFRRAVALPTGVRIEQLKAEMRDGVLEVRIPKNIEVAEGTTLTIK